MARHTKAEERSERLTSHKAKKFPSAPNILYFLNPQICLSGCCFYEALKHFMEQCSLILCAQMSTLKGTGWRQLHLYFVKISFAHEVTAAAAQHSWKEINYSVLKEEIEERTCRVHMNLLSWHMSHDCSNYSKNIHAYSQSKVRMFGSNLGYPIRKRIEIKVFVDVRNNSVSQVLLPADPNFSVSTFSRPLPEKALSPNSPLSCDISRYH